MEKSNTRKKVQKSSTLIKKSTKRFKLINQEMEQRAALDDESEHSSRLGNEKIAALIDFGNSKKADQQNNKEEDNEKVQKGGRGNAGEDFARGDDDAEEKGKGEGEKMEEERVGLVEMGEDTMEEEEVGLVEEEARVQQFSDKNEKNTNERLSADVTKENCQNENISRKRLRTEEEVDQSADKGAEEKSKREKTREKPEERKRKRLENEEEGESAEKETDDAKEEKKEEKSEKKMEDSHKFKMRLEEESRELELKLQKNRDYRPEPSVFSQEDFSDLDHLLEDDDDNDDCPEFQTIQDVFESEF